MKDASYLTAKTRKQLFLLFHLLLTRSLHLVQVWSKTHTPSSGQHTIPTDLTALYDSQALIAKFFLTL